MNVKPDFGAIQDNALSLDHIRASKHWYNPIVYSFLQAEVEADSRKSRLPCMR